MVLNDNPHYSLSQMSISLPSVNFTDDRLLPVARETVTGLFRRIEQELENELKINVFGDDQPSVHNALFNRITEIDASLFIMCEVKQKFMALSVGITIPLLFIFRLLTVFSKEFTVYGGNSVVQNKSACTAP